MRQRIVAVLVAPWAVASSDPITFWRPTYKWCVATDVLQLVALMSSTRSVPKQSAVLTKIRQPSDQRRVQRSTHLTAPLLPMTDSSQKQGLDPLSLPHANLIPERSVKLLDHIIRVPHAEVRKARYNGSEVCAKVLHLVGSSCERGVCERVSRHHTIELHCLQATNSST